MYSTSIEFIQCLCVYGSKYINTNIPRLSLIFYFLFTTMLTYKALRHCGWEKGNISISVRHRWPFLNWMLYCKHTPSEYGQYTLTRHTCLFSKWISNSAHRTWQACPAAFFSEEVLGRELVPVQETGLCSCRNRR